MLLMIMLRMIIRNWMRFDVDNCMLVRSCSSSKAKAAQESMKAKKAKIPMVPDKLMQTMSDDVNLANRSAKKTAKKKRKKKKAAVPKVAGPSTAATAGRRKRKAAASPVDEESPKRKAPPEAASSQAAPPVVCQTQVAAPTAGSRPTGGRKRQVAAPTAGSRPPGGRKRRAVDALSVAPVVEVLEAAPPPSYAGADLVTNRSVVWLYKLCDQLRESMNSVTTVMELSEPAIIVLNDIRSILRRNSQRSHMLLSLEKNIREKRWPSLHGLLLHW